MRRLLPSLRLPASSRRPPILPLLLTGSLSCGPEPTCPHGQAPQADGSCEEAEAAVVLEPLAAPRLLRRLSLDLRGTLPSLEELERVREDPGEIEALTEAYLADPRLEERLVHRLAETWHTRIDVFHVFYPEYAELAGQDEAEYAFERAVGEEPLRLAARIMASDRPWSDVVTTEDAVANELLESIWPLERQSEEPGWQLARWTDGRPAAGVLASNGLWWRYVTTVTNYNRLRVAAIQRLLICEDIQARPVSFAELPALADGDSVQEALRSTPYCMGCHAHIDPIAANLFGFWVGNEHSSVEVDTYHPEREPMGAFLLEVEPSWYGTPTAGLAELGQQIAADPRFDRCAAESAARMLWRRPVELADQPVIDELLGTYLDHEGRMLPLLAAVTRTASYRAGEVGGLATEADDARARTRRLVTGDTLASALEELTGFTWEHEGFAQLDNDSQGHRLLAGTVDGTYQTRPQESPSLTWILVQQRAAEGAADHLVQHDLGEVSDGTPRLLARVDLDTRPGDAAFALQLEDLAWRLWGLPLDAERAASLEALFTAAAAPGAGESPDEAVRAAWTAVLVAMLRDPDFGSY